MPRGKYDRRAMRDRALETLANRTHPGVVQVAETTGPAPEPMPEPIYAGPDPNPPAPISEHEMFQQPRLPEPALNRLAQGWVDNDGADEAFRRVVVEKLQEWEQTAPGDTAARETIYHQVRALRDWRAKLVQMSEASKKAEHRAERMRILAR